MSFGRNFNDETCILWVVQNVTAHLWSLLWKIVTYFNNVYTCGNMNECPLQVRYLHILITHSPTCAWDQSSWHWWAATASGACVARLGAVTQLTNGQHDCVLIVRTNGRHSEHALRLSIFLCTWWTLFHITLDAASHIVRVHYKSVKCNVLLSQGSVSSLLGKVDILSCVKRFFLLTAEQKL